MKKYSLSIAYVLLLTLCLPLACLYIWLLDALPVPWERLTDWADTFGKEMLVIFLVFLPVILYWLSVLVLGLAIFAAPVLLPFLVFSIMLTVAATWLAIIPGAFFGIQVIRFTVREKKIGPGAAVLHGILQFVFLADVLDAMYLAVKKWGRGKKSSAE